MYARAHRKPPLNAPNAHNSGAARGAPWEEETSERYSSGLCNNIIKLLYNSPRWFQRSNAADKISCSEWFLTSLSGTFHFSLWALFFVLLMKCSFLWEIFILSRERFSFQCAARLAPHLSLPLSLSLSLSRSLSVNCFFSSVNLGLYT